MPRAEIERALNCVLLNDLEMASGDRPWPQALPDPFPSWKVTYFVVTRMA